ncbi:MAG TPA: phosphatase PAP2 family protein [Candidatus Entotheonella sp.]|jgi:undecaprenyl-diphosphatase
MLAWFEQLDHQLFFAINNGWSAPVLDYLFWIVSTFGNGTGMVLGALVLLWCCDRDLVKRHWAWLLLAVFMGAAVMQALKYGIGRPRPLSTFALLVESGQAHINVVGRALSHRSFPSGHAQAAASVLTYLGCLYPRYWLGWGTGILLAAIGRVYVGVHFPSDVIAGAIIGSFSAFAVVYLQTHISAFRMHRLE